MILCVERDPYVRELETFFLTEAGFSVTFADDGVKALELAQQLHPNVIITEILVPRLDGLALCRRLKSDPATSDIAVLVFSLLSAESRAKDAGADASPSHSRLKCERAGRCRRRVHQAGKRNPQQRELR